MQALLDAQARGEITSGEIVLVVSDHKDAYALTRAANAGVATELVTREDYPTQSVFEERLIAVLRERGIELVILAGFMRILSENFTSLYPKRILNVHPSLIPSFCGKGFYGLRVHEAALAYGVKVTGATVHYVNHIPDGGEIILQKAVEIKEGDTPEILQRRVMEEAEWLLLPRAAELVSANIQQSK